MPTIRLFLPRIGHPRLPCIRRPLHLVPVLPTPVRSTLQPVNRGSLGTVHSHTCGEHVPRLAAGSYGGLRLRAADAS
jgi:hypothetical protein